MFSQTVEGKSVKTMGDTLWIHNGERSIFGVLSKPANTGKK